MKRYVLIVLLVLASTYGALFAFNAAVDPWDIYHREGLRKTRKGEDGRRVNVGFALAGAPRTLLLGNSRTQEGFEGLSAPWGGDTLNGGLPGANAFELARALALAARAPELKCVVLALDFQDYDAVNKIKGGFWLSPMSDGSTSLAYIRTAGSRLTLQRSLETLYDNATHGIGPILKPNIPRRAGEQRDWFHDTGRVAFENYRASEYDPERVAFVAAAVDRLTANGVQVIGVFTPLHAWQSEALNRAGAGPRYLAWRRDVTTALSAFAGRKASAPCVSGDALTLHDFAGYQAPSVRPLPALTEMQPDPNYHEASHFTPAVGSTLLAALQKPDGDWGAVVTPATLAQLDRDTAARRQAWLAAPAGQEATAFFDRLAVRKPGVASVDRYYIGREDWDRLRRSLSRPPKAR